MFKVISGTIKKDMTIYNAQKDTDEKIAHVYICKGKELVEVDEVQAGDIGALSKLSNTSTNDTLTVKDNAVKIEGVTLPIPVHAMAISPKGKGDEDKISAARHLFMVLENSILIYLLVN